jgi:membrane protease YdiL (CAAX protease family)
MKNALDLSSENRKSNAHGEVATYFLITFAISWTGALLVALPHLLRHEHLSSKVGIVMFPVMLLGPGVAGIALTFIGSGGRGLQDLWSRMSVGRVPLRWCFALLIPPLLVLTVLLVLRTFVSPVYAPNRFFWGILFGIPAGLLEEVGWMGYAFPRMYSPSHWLRASVVLGLLWSVWHLPVVDFLGAASPHRSYWLPFFFAFTLAMTAMRVVIAWIYVHTRSLLLSQLMHISSTGSLVVFSAPQITPGQEAAWYAIYGAVLWLLVIVAVLWQSRGWFSFAENYRRDTA